MKKILIPSDFTLDLSDTIDELGLYNALKNVESRGIGAIYSFFKANEILYLYSLPYEGTTNFFAPAYASILHDQIKCFLLSTKTLQNDFYDSGADGTDVKGFRMRAGFAVDYGESLGIPTSASIQIEPKWMLYHK